MTASLVDYTSRDYDSLRSDMIARMREALPTWSSVSPTDFLLLLIEIQAYSGDIANYYVDRVANEAFLQTAALRASVLRIAEMLDYTPISQQAASTTVTFTSVANVGTIIIPTGTQVITSAISGGQPIYFETTQPASIVTGTTQTVDVPAAEGRTVTKENVATSAGVADQIFTLFNANVIQDSWHVYVSDGPVDSNGLPTYTEWAHVDHMIDATGTQSAFTTFVDDNNITSIIFGDNASGKIPPVGNTIQVTYRYGVGAAGNIGAGLVRNVVTNIPNIIGVTNGVAAAGGSDPESIESMRLSIPRSVRALERAVTLADYTALAMQVPGITKSSAVGGTASSVTLYVASNSGAASAPLKAQVSTYFSTRIMAGSSLTVADPTFVPVNITMAIEVNERYLQATVKQEAQQALADLLSLTNVRFATRVTLANVFKAVINIEGVDYATISVLSTGVSGAADIQLTAGQLAQAGTISLTATGGIF